MATVKLQHWTSQQVRAFVGEIKLRWGGGWEFFTNDIRGALVDAMALSVVRAQDASTIEIAAVTELSNALREAMKVQW